MKSRLFRHVGHVFHLLPILLLPFMTTQAQWSSDPAVNNPIVRAGGNQTAPRIISDGKDGAIICWSDERHAAQSAFDIYAQRIDKDGFVRWTVNGNVICDAALSQLTPDIVSDGAGGAIIAWTDTRDGNNDIYVQRIDSSGTVLWAANGVALTTDTSNQADPKVTSDGQHGAIVTWNQNLGGFPPNTKILAQRVDASGTPLWSAPVAVSGKLRYCNAPVIASDGDGGAYIAYAYFDRPEYDVYAQRIDANGAVLWAANGVAIANPSGTQDSPVIIADGAGNAFIAYLDWHSGAIPDVNLVVLKKDGSKAASMRATSTSGGQANPKLWNIAPGVAGVVWDDGRVSGKRRVFAQIIDTLGVKAWAADGVSVTTHAGDQIAPNVIGDGNGGLIVAWEDRTKGAIEGDMYAQRLSGTGSTLWAATGVPVSTAARIQQFPRMIPDGHGGVILTWEDFRLSLSNADIFAARLLDDGTFPIGPPVLDFSAKSVAFGTVALGTTATKNLTLTNTGGSEVTIASVSSSDPRFSLTTDENTIVPGGSLIARVRYQPTDKNIRNAVIVVESNSVFSPDTITVSGAATGTPAILTDRMALDFGSVGIGSSKPLVLRISNPGNDTLVISSIATNNPRFTTAVTARTLAPGEEFDDTIRFTPTAAGAVGGNLTLTSNAPTSPTVVTLSGSGTTDVTMLIEPTDISFGNVPVGAVKDSTLTITNGGNDTLRISAITVDDARFMLVSSVANIPPAGTLGFTVRFSPDATGAFNGSFTITSNASGSPHVIAVDGVGVNDPAISFDPAELDFGEVETGKSKDLPLTIHNTGTLTLSVTALTSSHADFVPQHTAFEIPGGASFAATIRFTPSAIGDRAGTLSIVSNAASSPDAVELRGTGTDVSPVESPRSVPGVFTLHRNYPNPFQPSTTIRYDLETSAPVHLTVHDAVGRTVATLVDEIQHPGEYRARWNAATAGPGLYFYHLRVGLREASGTMILMK